MDISLIVSIIAGIITLILGVWSIFLIYKRHYPGKVTFFNEDTIGLVDGIVKNIPELSLLYNGEPVKEQIVLLKGYFQNTGSIDITENMQTEEKLTISLPSDYKWLSGKIVASSPKIKANITIRDNRKLEFHLGLFRCNEVVKFDALAEIVSKHDKDKNSAQRLIDGLDFTHRIANVQKVERSNTPPESEARILKKSIRRNAITTFSILILAFTFIFSFLFVSEENSLATIHYNLTLKSGKTIETTIIPKADGHLTIVGIDTTYMEELTLEEFFKNRQWEPQIYSDTYGFTIPLILGSGVMLMSLILISIILIGDVKRLSQRKKFEAALLIKN